MLQKGDTDFEHFGESNLAINYINFEDFKSCFEEIARHNMLQIQKKEEIVVLRNKIDFYAKAFQDAQEKLKQAENEMIVSCRKSNLLQNFLDHSRTIEIIKVKTNYECFNGLIGMKRDIMMRLIFILGLKKKGEKCIRSIFGIGKEIYAWKKSPIFHWSRYKKYKLPLKIVVFDEPDISDRFSFLNNSLSFDTQYKKTTIFFDFVFGKGVFKFETKYFVDERSWSLLGIADSKKVGMFPDLYMGKHKESACIKLHSSDCLIYYGMANMSIGNLYEDHKGPSIRIGMELDMNERRLFFFYNGVLINYVVDGIPFPSVSIGIYSYLKQRFEDISLRRISVARKVSDMKWRACKHLYWW